jgi:5'-nucleotidase
VLDRILITNDDGIDAPGLAVLEHIAAELAHEVWVVAPEHDQSGISHAISLHHPVRIISQGPRRFGITGTPGDCAVAGICHLMPDAPPDLVLSGVNRGANLGMETVFSGTVGGAMTAMMLGVPAIALSQSFVSRDAVPWHIARGHGPRVIRDLLARGWPSQACLNINFPDRPEDQVGPATLCRQGVGRITGMDVETRTDPRGSAYHWISFRHGRREQAAESDFDALRQGRITVTPLRYDRTDEDAFAALATHLPRLAP